MVVSITWLLPMNFPTRLATIRKSQGLTQQGLADAAELHINQVRRYETGSAQPTLERMLLLDEQSKVPDKVPGGLKIALLVNREKWATVSTTGYKQGYSSGIS